MNAYYDYDTDTIVTPFVGAGIGFTQINANNIVVHSPVIINDVEINDHTIDDDDTVFAWQILAGLDFSINEKVSFEFCYRLFSTADPNFEYYETDYLSHNIIVGVRYFF